jgi:hypothetical protein
LAGDLASDVLARAIGWRTVHHGRAAFGYDRKTETWLLSRAAAGLDRLLSERYRGKRMADDSDERYLDAPRGLRAPGRLAQLAGRPVGRWPDRRDGGGALTAGPDHSASTASTAKATA